MKHNDEHDARKARIEDEMNSVAERMNEAKCLLERAKPDYHAVVNKGEYDAWIDRRDAWLKGGGE
jgi:hypothetical protein